MAYDFVQCESCSLRFPGEEGVACPLCSSSCALVAHPLAAAPMPGRNARPLRLLVDNVRSVFNVGSIFRTADGCGIEHLYLGGISPTAEHKLISKTALGAERTVPWSQHRNGVELAGQLVAEGFVLWALEACTGAALLDEVERPERLVLVVGNEVSGVDPGIVALCDRCIAIPMRGGKQSLNVATAVGIAAYHLS